MLGRQVADVVFCLDASGSMGPCFDALRKHVQSFVKGLEAGGQFTWDLRLDFLAYNAGESPSGGVFSFRSLHLRDLELVDALYRRSGSQSGGGTFFTTNLAEFSDALDAVQVGGDEASFIALDTALDFPWRESTACHRVVILMTDESLETGVQVGRQITEIPALIEKLHALRVKLFIVGPPSEAFDAISAADRSEYQILQNAHDGLKHADFKQILGEIGKSVSVSTLQGPSSKPKVQRGLFDQEKWEETKTQITGD
jgi:hypothetical protein